jgi:NAD(P)-dependent dehydrogenase (short-subunit alcohol dehydrogenase family)
MPSVLITGANRGLGLGLLKLYAADGWRVYACCRDPGKAKALSDLAAASGGRVTVHRLDVEDHASIEALAQALKGQSIDVLLNVAGWYGSKIVSEPGGLQKFGESDYAEWARIYRINVMGPMKLCETFVEHVAASSQKKIVNISSIVGSIGTIGHGYGGNMYGYRASKAALNAITRAMAEDLKGRGLIVVPLHPGWVRTDMGGPGADIDVDTSVRGMKKVIDGLTPADSGKFLVYDGSTLPW